MVGKSSSKSAKFGAVISPFWEFPGKNEILSTRNPVRHKFAAVHRKIATCCPELCNRQRCWLGTLWTRRTQSCTTGRRTQSCMTGLGGLRAVWLDSEDSELYDWTRRTQSCMTGRNCAILTHGHKMDLTTDGRGSWNHSAIIF